VKRKLLIAVITAIVLIIIGVVVVNSTSSAAQIKKYMKLGNKYLQEGKYEEAILAFNKVIEIEPKNIEARLKLADAYVATNKFEDAERVLREALNIDKTRAEVNLKLIDVHAKTNEDAKNHENIYNKVGNLVNGGFVTEDKDWIYFANDNAIYKMDKNDINKKYTIINFDKQVYISYLNLYNDILYFFIDGNIVSLKNGENKLNIIAKDSSYSSYLTLNGDRLYYINQSDNIISMKCDGTDVRTIDKGKAKYINVVEDWIYYINLDDAVDYKYVSEMSGEFQDYKMGKIYKIKKDGSNKTRITDDGADSLNVYDNWIYYSNGNDGESVTSEGDSWYSGKLYKINTEGKEKYKLFDSTCDNINVTKDWIYFRDSGKKCISRISKESNEFEKIISTVYGSGPNIINKELFFTDKIIPLENEIKSNCPDLNYNIIVKNIYMEDSALFRLNLD